MPRGPKGELRVSSAMAAGLSKTVMDWSAIIEGLGAEAPNPGPRGPYKKRLTA